MPDDPSDGGAEAARVAADAGRASFAQELRALHIACGAPTLGSVVAAAKGISPSVAGLSDSGLSEILNGKRLPSLDVTVLVVRALSKLEPSTLEPPPQQPEERRRVVKERLTYWQARWREVQYLQKEADRLSRRARSGAKATATSILESADSQAEQVVAAAAREAEQLLADARAEAEAARNSAHAQRAEGRAGAAELVDKAQAEAAEIRAGAHAKTLQVEAENECRAGELERLVDAAKEDRAQAASLLRKVQGGTDIVSELAGGNYTCTVLGRLPRQGLLYLRIRKPKALSGREVLIPYRSGPQPAIGQTVTLAVAVGRYPVRPVVFLETAKLTGLERKDAAVQLPETVHSTSSRRSLQFDREQSRLRAPSPLLPGKVSGQVTGTWLVTPGEHVKQDQTLLRAQVGEQLVAFVAPMPGRIISLNSSHKPFMPGDALARFEPDPQLKSTDNHNPPARAVAATPAGKAASSQIFDHSALYTLAHDQNIGLLTLPAVPEINDGVVLKWHVHTGERVRSGERLLEVEDQGNIVYMFAAPHDGVLGSIPAPHNMRIRSGAPVAWYTSYVS